MTTNLHPYIDDGFSDWRFERLNIRAILDIIDEYRSRVAISRGALLEEIEKDERQYSCEFSQFISQVIIQLEHHNEAADLLVAQAWAFWMKADEEMKAGIAAYKEEHNVA